jgi:hypothetical protein
MVKDGASYQLDVKISYMLVESKLNSYLLKPYYNLYDMSQLYY